MTDHKASIKIRFEIYGEVAETDMWINYDGHDYTEGVDRRVTEFFQNHWRKAYAKYIDDEMEGRIARERAETERSEREQLAYLKGKYEDMGPALGGQGDV